jgi:nucleoside-diphosphate-sugar epimerase
VLEGAETHGVSRNVVHEDTEDVRWWQADLLDLKDLDNLLRRVKPDFVYHLSGHVSAAPQPENVLPAYHSLLTSTVNLLTLLASGAGCSRIILTGSLTEPPPGSVDTPPSSPYAVAKWAGAAYGRMFHLLYGVPMVLARPYMVFGPRQQPTKIIPYTISSLAKGVRPSLASGTWSADWIYVSDLIEGLIQIATVAGIEGNTIEFGCGELTSIQDVVHRIADIMGTSLQPEFGTRTDRVGEVIRTADIASTNAKLGWKPAVSLDRGLALTVAWFREQLQASHGSSCTTSTDARFL